MPVQADILKTIDADCLIFDVDGVLLDTSGSYPEVIRRCVETRWRDAGGTCDARGYSDELNDVFKLHGSFNDDYDIAWILLCICASRGDAASGARLSTSLPTPSDLKKMISSCKGDCVAWATEVFDTPFERTPTRDLCDKMYFGECGEEPAYAVEVPQIDIDWKDLPLPAYIYTGRDMREWGAAKKVLGWLDFPDERVVARCSGMMKPSPSGIEHICRTFCHSSPAFFGDTASDRMAIASFGRGTFVAIGPLLSDERLHFDTVQNAVSSLFGGMR